MQTPGNFIPGVLFFNRSLTGITAKKPFGTQPNKINSCGYRSIESVAQRRNKFDSRVRIRSAGIPSIIFRSSLSVHTLGFVRLHPHYFPIPVQ
jgi:hypothetical protein